MFKIDNASFGSFIAELRKQKALTQKELAGKLFISDKAVSKWERGLSMPDVALLMPLSEVLGVTVTELLSARRIDGSQMDTKQVEELMATTIGLSEEGSQMEHRRRILRGAVYFGCICVVGLEILLLLGLGYTLEQLNVNILTVEILYLIFGGWFCFFVKERLPAYYDENKIRVYHDGLFKMSVPGIYFNNNNWPRIVSVLRIWTLAVSVLFPLVYLAISRFFPALWMRGQIFFILAAAFSLFVPVYAVGIKYK